MPWFVVSAGCSPQAIWCNSPLAASCESPLVAEPFSGLRFPELLVVFSLLMIDLLSCFKEGEQVGVELVFVRVSEAMRCARVDL